MRFSFYKFFIFLTGIFCLAQSVVAQQTYVPLDPAYYHLIDRYEIKSGEMAPAHFSAVKPVSRQAVLQLTDSLYKKESRLSRQDIFNLNYLSADNSQDENDSLRKSRRPLLKYLYRNKADLFHVQTPHFNLSMRPVLHFAAGKESQDSSYLFVNTRGMQIHGNIDGKVGFYSYIGENQAAFPSYVRQRTLETRALPNQGFWKGFGDRGFDYLEARGYLTVQATRHIGLQFGYDKNFIGNGQRSLILSDFSNNYLFLKVSTKVWKFQYTNLFTELYADVIGNETGLYSRDFPKKYMAFHHLSINLTKNLNIGVFESVVYGKADSLGGGFDMAYMNPIIFYRAVEHQGGSDGNALLGADFKWNFARHFSAYGQIVFDELIISELTSGNGWWGNKYAAQLGLKYIDALGIPNLDLQVEGNMARPYTYSHGNMYLNYAHYRQPLAHPLGANFREIMALAQYQPTGRLNIRGKVMISEYGTDEEGANWGGDILKSYESHEQDYENITGQGIANKLLYAEGNVSFQLKHNLFIDLKQIYRKRQIAETPELSPSWVTMFSLRLNSAAISHDF